MALYRKYRPQPSPTWSDRARHRAAVPRWRSGASTTYLFSGPRGCGKIVAQARSPELRPGPDGDAVRRVRLVRRAGPQRPGSVDVIELDAASHGGVDDTRELRDRAFYAPRSRDTASSSSTKRTWSPQPANAC